MPTYQTVPMKEFGDRRYTFDTEKPVTSPEEYRHEFIRAYHEGRLTPVSESDPAQLLNAFASTITASVAPIVGGAAGTALGGPVLGAIGAGGGELLNQQLGVTPPSSLQAGLAAAGPAIPAAVGFLGTQIPGAAVGVQQGLSSLMGKEGARIIQQMVTKEGPSRALFQQVEAQGKNVLITPTNLSRAAKDLGEELSSVVGEFKPQGALKLVQGAEKLTGAGDVMTQFGPMPASMIQENTSVPFNVFRRNQQGLGEKMRSLIAQEGEGAGVAKKLYGAMWDDVDALVANTPGPLGQTLAKAVAARKQEEAASLIRDFFAQGTTRQAGFENLNLDSVLTKVDRAKDTLTRLMGPEGFTDLETRLTDLARTNYPQIQRGIQTGQQVPYTTRAIVGGSLGLAGAELFAPGSSLGRGVGVGGGAMGAILAAEVLSHMLSSAPGRLIIAELTKRGATYQQIAQAGLQVGRAALFAEAPQASNPGVPLSIPPIAPGPQ